MKANANGNKTFSTFKQGLKMTMQNGPVEERLHSATSAVVISMEPLMREALVKNNNCWYMPECLVPKWVLPP